MGNNQDCQTLSIVYTADSLDRSLSENPDRIKIDSRISVPKQADSCGPWCCCCEKLHLPLFGAGRGTDSVIT